MAHPEAAITEECLARLDATALAMRGHGISMLVVLGRGLITQYGYLQYLSGYCPMIRVGALVIRDGKAPVLLLPTVADVSLARERTSIEDMRVAGVGADGGTQSALAVTLAGLFADMADGRTEGHEPPRTIGVVGLGDILIAEEFDRWRKTMPSIAFVNASSIVKTLKARKSANEIAQLELAAGIADAGMDALLGVLRSRRDFRRAAGAAEAELRAHGASEVLVYLSQGPHYRHRPPAGGPTAGDLLTVFVELSNENGYWAEFARLVAVGPLDDEAERLASHCMQSIDLAENLLRTGAVSGEIYAALADSARSEGYDFDASFGHGIGLDHDLPNISPGAVQRLEEGMVVSMHPQFLTAGHHRGASLGDAFVVSSAGARPLSKLPRTLLSL